MYRAAVAVLAVYLPLAVIAVAVASAPERPSHPEAQLVQALDALQQGQADALPRMRALVQAQPNFRLAQMIYADLLRAQAGAPQALAVQSRHVRLQQLIEEARSRWTQSQAAGHDGLQPTVVPRLAQGEPLVLVDLAGARLYLLRGNANNQPVIEQHFYAGIGVAGFGKQVEGDGKTPVGVYRITGFSPDETLPDFYGAGALVLDYPNRIDRKLQRTGSGIWIHGVPPNTYTRAPRSSRGCVTLANEDLLALRQALGKVENVMVLLSNEVSWVAPDAAQQAGLTLLKAMDAWRRDWESRDVDRLLSHYATEYQDARGDLAAFAEHKRRVNAHKRRINVRIDSISLYAYPTDQPARVTPYVARFRQRYASDNFHDEQIKEQLWGEQNGRWMLFTEGDAALH